jgi:hypothetical protein
MTFLDTLNAKIARDHASDDEVARIAGMTVEEFDADTTAADPCTITLDTPVRGSVFNRFVTAYGITDDREQFHKFALDRYRRDQWTWPILAELWTDWNNWGREALIEQQDAADEQRTMADALI